MIRLFSIMLAFAILAGVISCGPSPANEKAVRQSQRFYEAAYISWYDQGDTLTAIRHLSRAVDENEANDDAQYLLGMLRLSRSEYEEAEKHLLLALKYRGEDRPSARVEAQNSLAVVYIHTDREAKAVPLLEAASKEVLNREPWLAFGNLGWAYTELREYKKAEDALKRALFDQPRFCVGRYRLGNLYYVQGLWDKAQAQLETTISVQEGGCDRLQEAWQLLAMTYLRLENVDKAIEAFEKCTEINLATDVGIECRSKRSGL